MKTNIFKIRSKYLHLEISSYLQKITLLQIIKYSNKLQKYTDITLEDYVVYSIINQKPNKNPSLPIKIPIDEKEEDIAIRMIKSIIDYTKTKILDGDQTEIKVPTPIYGMIQLKDGRIIVSTESSLLIITYDKKENQFFIVDNIDTNTRGAVINLIELDNNLLLTSTFGEQIKIFNLDNPKDDAIFEISGSCPLLLNDGSIFYIYQDKEIRINSKRSDIDSIKLKKKEKDDEYGKFSYSIQLQNGNVLLSCWDKTISEYDIKNRNCVNIINTNVEYIDFLYELKDGRIVFTAIDNARIFIMNKKEKGKNEFFTLNGHNNSVIKIIQLENESLISASYDGKIKFWVKNENGNFNCSMTFLVSIDYIRQIILLNDKRILCASDDKTLKAIGLNNNIDNITIELMPEDKKNGIPKSFRITDNRIK